MSRALLLQVGAWLALSAPVAACAAGDLRLLMFDAPDCEFCERFEQEVGGAYAHTAEGRLAPLARRALDDGVPGHLALADPVLYTPTFVLLEDGREVGRITGYPGNEFFWSLLGELLESRP